MRLRVLTECGYRCAVPTCRTILAIDLHHIVEVERGGGSNPDNLLALCPTCHGLYHRGTIHQESIRTWKAMILAISHAFDRSALDDLHLINAATTRMPGEGLGGRIVYTGPADSTLIVSGDAILQRSGLMATGLIGAFNWQGRGEYTLFITPKGRLFVTAYRNGDMGALQRILSGQEPLAIQDAGTAQNGENPAISNHVTPVS